VGGISDFDNRRERRSNVPAPTAVVTMRCDVLVLGSTLGGLVAATYLARAGLRVLVIEEEAHAKRPPALREPFLLSGLDSAGLIRRVLREVAVPLREQREMRTEDVATQVVLPDSRIDVLTDREAMIAEFVDYQMCDADTAAAWLDASDAAAQDARASLWEDLALMRGTRLGLPRAQAAQLAPQEIPCPPSLRPFADPLIAALSGLADPAQCSAPGLLLRCAREGVYRMPDAGTSFLDLFRQRITALHGEIRAASSFGIIADKNEIGIEPARGQMMARALVIAAPHETLRRCIEETHEPPPWLQPSPPPLLTPPRIFRVERDELPPGLARRAIVSTGELDSLRWLSRTPDPTNERVEWLVVGGPGVEGRGTQQLLEGLTSFPIEGMVPADPGPAPRWDLDTSELLAQSGDPIMLRQKAPVVTVGPDLGPGLGFEAQILQARLTALTLARRLGGRRLNP
jgi:hypothetical protein